MSIETNNKIKEMTFEYERKITLLSEEVTSIKELYQQTLQTKEDLQGKVKSLEANIASSTKKYQEDLKTQMDKFDYYRNNV